MTVLFDDFPFFLVTENYSDNIEVLREASWMGPITPETEEARIQGLKDAWVGQEVRRQEHAERMKANRYEGPTHVHGQSKEHRANNAIAQLGNQNSRKPHKYPATRKSPK